MLGVHIKPCLPQDLVLLQDIAINSYGDHYLYLWHDGGAWYLERSFSEASLKAELQDTNAAFYLVYEEQELIGFLKLNLNKAVDGYSADEALELERIYLLKSATGRGIGHKAVAFTKDIARQQNKKVIWLKAMDSSASVMFYERNGFRKCGTYTLDFEAMKEAYRGMFVMKLELDVV